MFHIDAVHIHVHLHTNPAELAKIDERLTQIMATQEQLAADLAAVTAKVEKIGGETRTLLTKVAELTDALAAAGNTNAAVDAALQALKDQVAVVDDLVPDPAPPVA